LKVDNPGNESASPDPDKGGQIMTVLMGEIEKQAKLLSVQERELLAERLLATVSSAPLTDLDVVWLEEAEKRYSSWKAGRTKGLSADNVLADIRRELRQ
jgi:hypothetical protein